MYPHWSVSLPGCCGKASADAVRYRSKQQPVGGGGYGRRDIFGLLMMMIDLIF
jgi:hypothetical protein